MEKDELKREQYRQTRASRQRTKRLERLKEKGEGRLDERNLSFITTAMKRKGMNNYDLAKKTGMKPQLLHYYLEVHDNCKLSIATKICNGIGYKLTYEIKARGLHPKGFINKDACTLPKAILDCLDKPESPVGPLAQFVVEREYSFASLSSKTGIDKGKYYRAFTSEDISIEDMLATVQAYDHHINWILVPLDEDGNEKKTPVKIMSRKKTKSEVKELSQRLRFLTDYIKKEGKDTETVIRDMNENGEKTGAGIFILDDCSLSEAEKIVSATNGDHTLSYTFVPAEEKTFEDVKHIYTKTDERNIKDNLQTRLRPLALEMDEKKIGVRKLSAITGIPETSIRYTLAVHDIKISRLELIAKKLGNRIEWYFD